MRERPTGADDGVEACIREPGQVDNGALDNLANAALEAQAGDPPAGEVQVGGGEVEQGYVIAAPGELDGVAPRPAAGSSSTETTG